MNLDPNITPEELKVFLEEADEQIELLDEDIIRLEKEGENPDLLQEIFRAAHTLKGSSAMVGHQRMAELTHAMESLLDILRNEKLTVSTEIIDALLYGLDALKILKNEITSLEDSDLNTEPVIAKLREAAAKDIGRVQVEESVLSLEQDARDSLQRALARGQNVYNIKVSINKESDWAAVRCLQCLNDLARIGEVIASAPSAKEIEEEKTGFDLEVILASSEDKDTIQGIISSIAEIVNVEVKFYHLEKVTVADKELTPTEQRVADQGPEAMDKSLKGKREVAQQEGLQSVSVDVEVLDNLMNIVAELVIDRSKISQVCKILQSKYANDEIIHELSATLDHIINVINELQESIIQVRIIPIGTMFNRFPRMVRALAQRQKKKLDFIVEGEETELDSSLIEQIRVPLIHLLRNAVDHGIESPEERKAAHKPEKAVVRLTALRKQNHIVITVEDDGSGIAADKIRASVIKNGLISAERVESLTKTETINLIFTPGMSTTEKATEVSGRGVGLDIVKANVENLSGSITLDTEVGQGTKFTIRLPLTGSIVQGLLVSAAGVIYVLPVTSVVETLAIEPWEIQNINNKEIIRWRDRLIPLLRLNTTLNSEVKELESHGKNVIVVVKAGDSLVGITVDALMEPREIVVKSLGKYLGDIEGIAGATILGDGRVALILDVASLAKMAIQKHTGKGSHKTQTVTKLSPASAR